ncbi:MAG: hypothetical protein K2N44_16855 [Lachnospiraceae bacterium]|nr:hypothetical protein [Lachnospiraceae bacterium]
MDAKKEEEKEQKEIKEKEAEENDGKEKGEINKKAADENEMEKIFDEIEKQEDKKDTYILYRTINNYGVMAGDDARFENITIRDQARKKGARKSGNIFADKEELNNWLDENYESYSMALMISAAVFETQPYIWVVQAADRLFQSFDHNKEEDVRAYGMTDLLSRFGAEICQGEMNTYTGITSVEVVHLTETEYREKILRFIWKECPQLHDKIILWLESYSMQKPVLMSRAAMEVVGLLVSWDYYFFLNNMVNKIQNEKRIATDMLIAQIVIALNRDETYQKNVYNLLQVWSKEHRIHYLLTGLFVCVGLKDKNDILENIIERYIQNMMKEICDKNLGEYSSFVYDFFAVGMRAFTFYRILVEKIYALVQEGVTPREKKDICRLFLYLFSTDISLARIEDKEEAIFIKLCMVQHDVSAKICLLWQMVWQCRDYRELFYLLLARYDVKINKAGTGCCSVDRFIDKAFGAVCTKEMRNDISSKVHRRAGNE